MMFLAKQHFKNSLNSDKFVCSHDSKWQTTETENQKTLQLGADFCQDDLKTTMSLSKPPQKNKIFQWNSASEVCKGKTMCHTKLFIWTKTDGKLLQVKTNITLVLTFVKVMPTPTFVKVMPKTCFHCKNKHAKHDFSTKKHAKVFLGQNNTSHLIVHVNSKECAMRLIEDKHQLGADFCEGVISNTMSLPTLALKTCFFNKVAC